MRGKCLCFILLFMGAVVVSQNKRPVGINISNVADYSTELVFTNTFRQCREWISSNANDTGPWDTGVTIPLRADGYPIQVPFQVGNGTPQKVKTLLVWDLFSATPVGKYRLKTHGKGRIRLRNGASGEYVSPADVLVSVNDGVILEILQSDKNDPVRDIQFILPEYANASDNQTFTNAFRTFLSDFQVIRFMDFTHTNGSTVKEWQNRTLPDYYTQSKESGAAWEYAIQLANETGKDLWVNIPHLATDAYVDSLARLLQKSMHPGLKVYLEYSNEVWNGAFSQHQECAGLAQTIGISGQPWERAWKYTAKRSADIFKIWKDVFTDHNRLVCVIPSQAANAWLTNELITYFNDPVLNPHQLRADAVAIAPYFGHEVADKLVSENKVQTVTIPEIMELLKSSLQEPNSWISEQKAVAEDHQLRLIAYEGGQHLVGTGNNLNNDLLTQKLISANRQPAMKDLYCQYVDDWYATSTDLFCHFNSIQPYTRYGSWGLMENHADTSSPKYTGLKECVFSYNQTTHSQEPDDRNELVLSPNPTHGILQILGDDSPKYYVVYNSLGQLLLEGRHTMIDLQDCPDGLLFIKISDQVYKIIKHN